MSAPGLNDEPGSLSRRFATAVSLATLPTHIVAARRRRRQESPSRPSPGSVRRSEGNGGRGSGRALSVVPAWPASDTEAGAGARVYSLPTRPSTGSAAGTRLAAVIPLR